MILIILFIVLISSGFLKGLSGFGTSLFLAGILISFYEPVLIIPVLAVLSLLLNIALLIEHWQLLPLVKNSFLVKKETLFSLVIGIIVGVLLLSYISQSFIKIILGTVILLCVGLLFVKKKTSFSLLHSYFMHIGVGFFSGLFSGLVNVNGPPAAVVASYERLNKSYFVASMIIFMLIADSITILLFFFKGFYSSNSFFLITQFFPLVILGLIGGRMLRSSLSEKKFHIFMLCLLLFVGLKLIFESIF